jgi:bla regulator protein blaR1
MTTGVLTRIAAIFGAAVLAVAAGSAPAAQTLSFEVASVKRNNSGDGSSTRRMQPGGTTFVNVPLRQLIIGAYGVQPFQVIGGPAWITSDRFDINAKAEGAPSPEQMNLMLRTLLAERFKLVVRHEQREMPIYTLVKAREDGQLGPALKPSAADCGAPGRGRGPAPAGPGAGGAPALPLAGCRTMIAPGRVEVGGQPISQLATLLSNQVGRSIIDKTGLTGRYDLQLSFLPDAGRGAPIGPPPPGATALPPIDPDAPSIFTALQEQLGLKLESGRGPVDVIVIESVEPPTED